MYVHLKGKLIRHSMATNDSSPRPCRLFITDMTKTQYLIDIGFDVTYLRTSAKATLSSNTLFAANRSIIVCYIKHTGISSCDLTTGATPCLFLAFCDSR